MSDAMREIASRTGLPLQRAAFMAGLFRDDADAAVAKLAEHDGDMAGMLYEMLAHRRPY